MSRRWTACTGVSLADGLQRNCCVLTWLGCAYPFLPADRLDFAARMHMYRCRAAVALRSACRLKIR